MRQVAFKRIKVPRKAAGILLNDQCPLRCAHCSMGYSDSNPGTRATVGEDKVAELVETLIDHGFDMIAFTGGEPTVTPQLLRVGLKTARARGVTSVVVTAPVWARSPAAAEKFVRTQPDLDMVILSYDRHHLGFLTIEHYANAAAALLGMGASVTFNIGYSNQEELAELQASLRRLYPDIHAMPEHLAGVSTERDLSWQQTYDLVRAHLRRGPRLNSQRIVPVGNAATLPGIFREAVRLESIEDFDRIERSCNVGNIVAVDAGMNLHACCWAPVMAGSPLTFKHDHSGGFTASLRALDTDERVGKLRQNGLIGSLTTGDKERLLASLGGQPFVNECHLCIAAAARPEYISIKSTMVSDE